jgi:hypothetical protein
MEVTMWKRLCCVPVTAELDEDGSRRALHFRIDYRRVDGELEHSFQIGEIIDGLWKRKDRFDDVEFFIAHHGTNTCHRILESLRREELLEDPTAAQRFVDQIVAAAERDNEDRKKAAAAKAAFIEMLMGVFGGVEVVNLNTVADVDPDSPIPLLPE